MYSFFFSNMAWNYSVGRFPQSRMTIEGFDFYKALQSYLLEKSLSRRVFSRSFQSTVEGVTILKPVAVLGTRKILPVNLTLINKAPRTSLNDSNVGATWPSLGLTRITKSFHCGFGCWRMNFIIRRSGTNRCRTKLQENASNSYDYSTCLHLIPLRKKGSLVGLY